MATQDERMAENEVLFRDANERIDRAAADFGVKEPLPFLCECERERCTEVLRVEPVDYERVRANPRRFLYAHGHERNTVTQSTVVTRNDGYIVVEKYGIAGEIAESTDQRQETDQDQATG